VVQEYCVAQLLCLGTRWNAKEACRCRKVPRSTESGLCVMQRVCHGGVKYRGAVSCATRMSEGEEGVILQRNASAGLLPEGAMLPDILYYNQHVRSVVIVDCCSVRATRSKRPFTPVAACVNTRQRPTMLSAEPRSYAT